MTRTMPSLTALRSFEAAARHQSFSLAADELLVTHAAISRQVRRLEEALDVRLFERTGNRVLLTAAGADLLPVLSRAFDTIAAATHRVAAGRQSRRLVLSVDPGLASRWLNGRLERFHRVAPDVDVEIIPTLDLVDFTRAGVDAAVHYSFTPPDEALRSVWLMAVEAFPVCSPGLMAAQPGLSDPADLACHRLLHEQDTSWWQRWLKLAGVQGVDWSKGTVYRDSGLVLDAAVAGHGVAVGDNLLAYEQLAAGDLVKPFGPTLPSGHYYLVKPERAIEHPALAVFQAWLVNESSIQALESGRWGAARSEVPITSCS